MVSCVTSRDVHLWTEMAFVLVLKKAFKKRRKASLLVVCVVVSALLLVVHHFNASQTHSTHRKPLTARLAAAATDNRSPPPVRSPDDAPPSGPFTPPLRLVHLDLKGAPPLPRFYAQLFPLLAALGANALLVEYEDMFPFDGLVGGVRAHNAYSADDVRLLVETATKHSLEVIPLVQTFGHLEFVLKLEPFSYLREVSSLPQALCPSLNDSLALVFAMVDQVMALHPRARWLHIGCDEVFQLGACERCRRKDRDRLFLEHVHSVAEYVVRRHHVIPIVWDDMLRQMTTDVVRESGLPALGVELMVWSYVKDIYRFVPYSQWTQFAALFPRVWIASAFKGAFGETLTVPNARWHLENNMAWLSVAREQRPHFAEVRGLVLTGWQRYDHLAALCELLPAAIPSLALSLISVTFGAFDSKRVFQRFDRALRCPADSPALSDDALAEDEHLWRRAGGCQFAGAAIFRLTESHAEVVKRVSEYLFDVTEHKAWLTEYNVRHNLSNPYRVDEGLQDFQSVYYSLQALMRTAKSALSEVYDKNTVFEWIEQNVFPYVLKMDALWNASLALKKASHWPRRPLPVLADLERRLDDKNTNFNYN